MNDLLHLKTISDLYKFLNLGYAQHPLVAIVDFSKTIEYTTEEISIKTDFYSIMFKNYCRNHIRYGRKLSTFKMEVLFALLPIE